MRIKKILSASYLVQLSLRPFVKRSRRVITHFEEPFYRTNNPMGYAVFAGIILGCFIFMLLSGKSLFGSFH